MTTSEGKEQRSSRARDANLALNCAWAAAGLKSTTLLVLIAIIDLTRRDGYCWATAQTIAGRARIGERQVRRIIADLERRLWLLVARRPYRRSRYFVSLPCARLCKEDASVLFDTIAMGDTGVLLGKNTKEDISDTSRRTFLTSKEDTTVSDRTLNLKEQPCTDPAPGGARQKNEHSESENTAPSRTADQPVDSEPQARSVIPANRDLKHLRVDIANEACVLPDGPYGDLVHYARAWQDEFDGAPYSGDRKRDLAALKKAREAVALPEVVRVLIPLFFKSPSEFEKNRGLLAEDFLRAIPRLVAEQRKPRRKTALDILDERAAAQPPSIDPRAKKTNATRFEIEGANQ